MKQLFVFLLILLISKTVCGQDTLGHLTRSWKDVEIQLLRRNDVAIVLLSRLIDLKYTDTTFLQLARRSASDLTIYLQTSEIIDTLFINQVSKKNSAFIGLLSRSLMTLENYPALRKKEEVRNLLTQLMGTENRIAVTKLRYNELCLLYQHNELEFEKKEIGAARRFN